ncbi:MAG: hypothetical protein AAF518_16210 [Spirochaetota bacterium]
MKSSPFGQSRQAPSEWRNHAQGRKKSLCTNQYTSSHSSIPGQPILKPILEVPMEQIDYAEFLDHLEIAIDRMHNAETYSAKRRKRYHDFALAQVKFLRMQLEPQVF